MNFGSLPASGTDGPPLGVQHRRARPLLLLVALAAFLFVGLSVFPLQEPDEGRYADIARAMATGGDLLTPRLNGIAYFEKPPLAFWFTAASLRLLGMNELGARFPFALCSLLTLLLVLSWGRRLAGDAAGISSALILATMPLYSLLSRIVLIDVILTLFITAALYSFFRMLEGPARARDFRRWSLACWAAMALAFLTKGPIGVVLPLGSILVHVLLTRSWTPLRRLLRWDGLLLFTFVAAPWFLFMGITHPVFVQEFFVGQNLSRLVDGTRFHREQPLWFYLPVLILGFLPWSFLIPGWICHLIRGDRGEQNHQQRIFLATSVIVPFTLFTVAQSKLAYYLIVAAPPLALLTGDLLDRSVRMRLAIAGRSFDRARRGLLVTSWLLLGCLAFSFLFPATWSALLDGLIGPFHLDGLSTEITLRVMRTAIRALLLALGSAALVAAYRLRKGDLRGALLSLQLALLALWGFAPWGAAEVAPFYSVKEVAKAVAENLQADEEVLLFGHYLRCVPFYLRRNVILWDARHTEFGHEVSREEAAGLALQESETELRRVLSRALVVVESGSDLEQLETLAPAFRLETLYRGYRFLVLRSTPGAPVSAE